MGIKGPFAASEPAIEAIAGDDAAITIDRRSWLDHHFRVDTLVERVMFAGLCGMFLMLALAVMGLLQWSIRMALFFVLTSSLTLAVPLILKRRRLIPQDHFKYWAIAGITLCLLILYSAPLGPYIFMLWVVPSVIAAVYMDSRFTAIASLVTIVCFNAVDMVRGLNIYSPYEYVDGSLQAVAEVLHFWEEQFYLDVSFVLVCVAVTLVAKLSSRLLLRSVENEAAAHFLKNHDALTGLRKFTHLSREVQSVIEQDSQEVAMLNINFFGAGEIGLEYGKGVSDIALIRSATRLGEALRGDSALSRIAGWEFAALFAGVGAHHDAEAAAKRVIAGFKEPVTAGDIEFLVDPRIGIAVAPRDADSADLLVKRARLASAQAVNAGRSSYRLYMPGLDEDKIGQGRMRSMILRALERGEFRLVYQPRVDVSTEQIVGLEALIRWESKEMGNISPSLFIPVAEGSDLICDIGEWVLEAAASQLSEWRRSGDAGDIQLSINVSVRQLVRPDLLAKLRSALDRHKLEPSSFGLEVTESLAIDNLEAISENLEKIRRLGVKTSIDDFGTGFASLSSISQFKVDALKIDGSFIRSMGENRESLRVVGMIIALARGLGMRTVAESVETAKQLAILRRLSIDEAQGYLFSCPVEAEAVPGVLKQPMFSAG